MTTARAEPFVPRYLRGAHLPRALERALSCPECGRPLHWLRPWYACTEGWHGKLLPASVLWERAHGLVPEALWTRLPRRLRAGAPEGGPKVPLILRRLLALLEASLREKEDHP